MVIHNVKKPNETAALSVNGMNYEDWESVWVKHALFVPPFFEFRFTCFSDALRIASARDDTASVSWPIALSSLSPSADGSGFGCGSALVSRGSRIRFSLLCSSTNRALPPVLK